jgi:TM2 domain-containing membrane protein YozV
MSLSEDPNKIPTPPGGKDPISAHRAFVYGACGPGFGEIYAGARLRGYATLALFIFFTVWFTWSLVGTIRIIVSQVFDSFNSLTPFVLPEMHFSSLAISFFGIYFIWLWAMLSAVEAAIDSRRNAGAETQASVGWAASMAWFCPGAGQIYTAERRLGFILFGAYLLGLLLIVPAYLQLFQSISELAKSGQLPVNNPLAVVEIVHELITKVNYSFGTLFQDAVKYFSVAAAMAALRHGPLHADTKWLKPSLAYGAALLGLGWLCPGSGQLLQGRRRLGWSFFAGYFGSKLLIGFLLGRDLITVQNADTLAWVYMIVQWAAMIEAPLAMRKAKNGNNRPGNGAVESSGR